MAVRLLAAPGGRLHPPIAMAVAGLARRWEVSRAGAMTVLSLSGSGLKSRRGGVIRA